LPDQNRPEILKPENGGKFFNDFGGPGLWEARLCETIARPMSGSPRCRGSLQGRPIGSPLLGRQFHTGRTIGPASGFEFASAAPAGNKTAFRLSSRSPANNIGLAPLAILQDRVGNGRRLHDVSFRERKILKNSRIQKFWEITGPHSRGGGPDPLGGYVFK
jgi:hypothetical protein